MRVLTGYRIYKDRFLLALAISLLAHLIAFFIYFSLPKVEKTIALQPLSLGVIQAAKPILPDTKPMESNPVTPPSKPKEAKNPGRAKPKASPSNKQRPPAPPAQTSIKEPPPSTDIDLNALQIPEEGSTQSGGFNPLSLPSPSLTNTLRNQQNNVNLEKLPPRILEELRRLYGSKLDRLSREEKDYIAESYFLNYAVFQQSADRLGYPKLAAYLKQQGEGIIEFTLYPDGHVDDIRILVSTKYEELDDSMRRVIEMSAKDLKRPPSPITVRIGGRYQIIER